jgi:hypothetical protein
MADLTAREHAERASSILVRSEEAVASLRTDPGPGGPGRQERARRIVAEGAALAQAHALTSLALLHATREDASAVWGR